MNKIIFLLFTIYLFISACSTSKLDLPVDKSIPAVLLPFKVKEIKITDQRDSLKTMNWDLPALIAKKKVWIGNPEISLQNKEDIERIIRSTEPRDSGTLANFEIKFIEGECKLRPIGNTIRQYVTLKAELTVTIPGRTVKYESIAEGNYEHQLFNGSKENAMEIYNLVVRNVTTELLKVVRDEIKQ